MWCLKSILPLAPHSCNHSYVAIVILRFFGFVFFCLFVRVTFNLRYVVYLPQPAGAL